MKTKLCLLLLIAFASPLTLMGMKKVFTNTGKNFLNRTKKEYATNARTTPANYFPKDVIEKKIRVSNGFREKSAGQFFIKDNAVWSTNNEGRTVPVILSKDGGWAPEKPGNFTYFKRLIGWGPQQIKVMPIGYFEMTKKKAEREWGKRGYTTNQSEDPYKGQRLIDLLRQAPNWKKKYHELAKIYSESSPHYPNEARMKELNNAKDTMNGKSSEYESSSHSGGLNVSFKNTVTEIMNVMKQKLNEIEAKKERTFDIDIFSKETSIMEARVKKEYSSIREQHVKNRAPKELDELDQLYENFKKDFSKVKAGILTEIRKINKKDSSESKSSNKSYKYSKTKHWWGTFEYEFNPHGPKTKVSVDVNSKFVLAVLAGIGLAIYGIKKARSGPLLIQLESGEEVVFNATYPYKTYSTTDDQIKANAKALKDASTPNNFEGAQQKIISLFAHLKMEEDENSLIKDLPLENIKWIIIDEINRCNYALKKSRYNRNTKQFSYSSELALLYCKELNNYLVGNNSSFLELVKYLHIIKNDKKLLNDLAKAVKSSTV